MNRIPEMDGLFHYNPERRQWEKLARRQYYKGFEILSIHYKGDYQGATLHRKYVVILSSDEVFTFRMSKRENLQSVKEWIDFLTYRKDGSVRQFPEIEKEAR